MTTFNNVEEIVSNLTKGTFGVTMVAVTIPTMSKRRRSGEVNPFYGRVHKCTMTTNIALGYDYQSNVNIRLERKGEEKNFEASKPSGKHWVNYPFILANDKNPEQHYLRVTSRKSSKSTIVWLLDGKPINANDIRQLMEWIPSSSSSKKQESFGLSEEEQVKVFDYKVEGIIAIAQGERIFNKLDKVFTMDSIKGFFK